MITIKTMAERLNVLPPVLVTGDQNAAKDVLAAVDDMYEYAERQIQNVGATNIYVAFGCDASAKAYHYLLTPLASLDCSNKRCRVSCIGAGAWTVTTVVSRRNKFADGV